MHLTQDLTRNLKARLSWSTSFGRPPLNSLLPNETINEANQTLTRNNPSLLPQTAANWDASLEYYFEPVGGLSVGWFRKSIKDFIVTGINSGTIGTGTDNGFSGEYGGFTRLTSANAGTATAYQFRPSLNFSVDVNNLTNEPQRAYRGIRDQMQTTLITGTSVTFGINGRF